MQAEISVAFQKTCSFDMRLTTMSLVLEFVQEKNLLYLIKIRIQRVCDITRKQRVYSACDDFDHVRELFVYFVYCYFLIGEKCHCYSRENSRLKKKNQYPVSDEFCRGSLWILIKIFLLLFLISIKIQTIDEMPGRLFS